MKETLKYVGVFVTTLTILILLLVLSCTIPQEKIYQNSKLSADYMTENEVDFYTPLLSNGKFKIHNYADAIWLSMAYSTDTEHPLKSALEGKYYNEFDDKHYNIYFYRDGINLDKEANTYYYRYWHGIIMFLRPLLTIFTYMDMRYMNVLFLTGLSFLLIIILHKKLGIKPAAAFAVAITMINFYAVPYCIEYVPMFYIMFISSIIVLLLKDRQKISYLFLITGICSNFFDFLTVETVTLCVPLIIHFYGLYNSGEVENFMDCFKHFVKLCILWLSGYVFTWISKWLITALVLRINVMENVIESVEERSVGTVLDLSFLEQIRNSIILNLREIFPFSITKTAMGMLLMVLAVLALLFSIWFLYRKPKIEPISKILILIALIPYIRYMVMSNHSYLHCWFTFRAQISSIMAVLLALTVNLDKNLLIKEFRLKRKTD